MSKNKALALLKAPQNAPLAVDMARAARIYPRSRRLQEQWLAAVQWMQQRPGGSIWLIDTNRPPSKWRAITEGDKHDY